MTRKLSGAHRKQISKLAWFRVASIPLIALALGVPVLGLLKTEKLEFAPHLGGAVLALGILAMVVWWVRIRRFMKIVRGGQEIAGTIEALEGNELQYRYRVKERDYNGLTLLHDQHFQADATVGNDLQVFIDPARPQRSVAFSPPLRFAEPSPPAPAKPA